MENIARMLLDLGIALEHFHCESAPGQWEFVLPPATPVQAVDTLLKARDTILAVARSFGVLATLHPRVSKDHSGTGAHVHISINPIGNCSMARSETFFAGIIDHMPSILAFTLPQEVSYERVQAGLWSGGEYACWGWENKDTPMRRVAENHFEFKLMDGLANPYLALTALLSSGLDGLSNNTHLTAGNCDKAPTDMTLEERVVVGVETLLPKTIEDSLAALGRNERLAGFIGETLVSQYAAVKRSEAQFLLKMPVEERRRWLISKY
ncbi:hypothetical protein N7532_002934 [Penicillium argentinense]|uniref:GS catalytic domain-containing protein n=1 Tax=Penicillium argentinense TaxID=1131581 RepID=A0A9W9G1A0_9EURO|nr:uncharacterized protein N7532_002934 [Penicillium argentinense]KAJ5110289.1 hypothetical protein N7532_002934 [Penicillium argentinense]